MNSDFSAEKILTGKNVLCAAIRRIEWLFETFSSVCLSFSGGSGIAFFYYDIYV